MAEGAEDIPALLTLLERAGFTCCRLEQDGRHLLLRLPTAAPPPPPPSEAPRAAPAAPEPEPNVLRSPRVGHFYPRTDLDGRLRFRKGETVEKGDVYGTIEAMHLRHELRAERAGVVDEPLAAEGEAVEYGQPLIRLRDGHEA